MKKIVWLLTILAIFIVPTKVLADENIENKQNDKVKVYLFHRTGCPHCEAEIEFLNSQKEEYGDHFELISYEVSSNKENHDLFEQVGKLLNADTSGVPFIVIGKDYIKGFGNTAGDEIIKLIEEEYNKPINDRYDAIYEATKPQPRNIIADIIVGVVTIAVVGGIIIVRYKNK